MRARPEVTGKVFGELADALQGDWRRLARPSQRIPIGNWVFWLILAGRGFGKTRCGAETTRLMKLAGCRNIGLIGATAADVRDTMIEGPSGLLTISPKHDKPLYEPSKRRISWRNGAIATAFSADEPDRLRGPAHDFIWADELAAWNDPTAWDQAQFGLRMGKNPRAVITTTPRPTKIIRGLIAREGADVTITRGSTFENAANLAPAFLNEITAKYAGSRMGRQEINAEVLDDAPGALWRREWIDRDRVEVAPSLRRIVVSVDPAVTSGEDADETGIVAAGVDERGHAYILDDCSMRGAPHEWAQRAIAVYRRRQADRLVAEINNGGEMVAGTIRMVDATVAFKGVHASRGKVTRAEPISALYEQGKVHHVGSFDILEDQMCGFTSDFDRARAGYSPDRVDSLVWGLSELCLKTVQPMKFLMPAVIGRGGDPFAAIGGRTESVGSWSNRNPYSGS